MVHAASGHASGVTATLAAGMVRIAPMVLRTTGSPRRVRHLATGNTESCAVAGMHNRVDRCIGVVRVAPGHATSTTTFPSALPLATRSWASPTDSRSNSL